MMTALDRIADSYQRGLGIPKDYPKGILQEVLEHASDQCHGEGFEEALKRAIAEAPEDFV